VSYSGASLAAEQGGNPAVARIAPFAVYIGFMIAGQQLATAYPQWDLRWLYAVQTGAVMLTLAMFWRGYVELGNVADVSRRAWLLALLAGVAVFAAWISLDVAWARMGDTGGFDPSRDDGRLDWTLIGVRLFGAVLIVPVMEELFWRSFILRWISQRDFLRLAPAAAGLRALLLSSLVFGVEHDLWLAGILAGLVYGALYMKSASLWPPIMAHAATNLLLGLWVVTTGHWRLW
jgi:uncharacterized protein